MKVLVITANPKPEQGSVTKTALSKFMEIFIVENPTAVITTRDVSNYDHLSGQELRDYRNPEGSVALVAKEFGTYDRYIFVAPMWNLSVPSGLKAYIDHLVIPDVTFTYEGRNPKPIGLLKNKKALYITASGGHFGVEPMDAWDHNIKYMEHILDHMGIEDFSSVYIPLAHRGGAKPDERIMQEMEQISAVAKEW